MELETENTPKERLSDAAYSDKVCKTASIGCFVIAGLFAVYWAIISVM